MFRKLFLLLPLVTLLATGAKAQFRYTFKDTTTAYVRLPAGAISVTNGIYWDQESFALPMPFSWALDSTIQLNTFNLSLGYLGIFSTLSANTPITLFSPGVSDFVDRGSLNQVSPRSPVRYLSVGTAPNRIFKVEIANAGFYKERTKYSTLSDSVSFQMWIYETSNIVEFHYGGSRITHFTDYFDLGTGIPSLITGFGQNLAPNGNSGVFYYLDQRPNSIILQSATLPNNPINGLSAWPVSGMVFRYTPIVSANVGVTNIAALENIKIYPNPASTSLFIEGAAAGTKATLYSMLGQPVLQTVLTGTQAMDIASLPAGVYKLVLTDKEGKSGATTVVKE